MIEYFNPEVLFLIRFNNSCFFAPKLLILFVLTFSLFKCFKKELVLVTVDFNIGFNLLFVLLLILLFDELFILA